VFFLSAREDIFLTGAVTLRRADLANILVYVLRFTVGFGTLKRDVVNANARCVLPTSRTTLYIISTERDFGVGVTGTESVIGLQPDGFTCVLRFCQKKI
jgi:hypothetical protein